jgi:hypothetical protein
MSISVSEVSVDILVTACAVWHLVALPRHSPGSHQESKSTDSGLAVKYAAGRRRAGALHDRAMDHAAAAALSAWSPVAPPGGIWSGLSPARLVST